VDSTPTTHAKATPTFSSCPVPHSLSSSRIHALVAPPHLPRTARAPRELHHRRVPAVSVAPVSSASTPARDTHWFTPSPFVFHYSRSLDLHRAAEGHRRRIKPSSCPCRRSSVSEPSLKVTKLSMPLISHSLPLCVRNCSLEQGCAATMPLRRRPPPSSAFVPVSCPRLCPPCQLEPSRALPSNPGPLVCPCSRLWRGFTAESVCAAAGSQGKPTRVGRLISDVYPRSGVPFESGHSGARPRSCSAARSSRSVRLTPRSLTSLARLLARTRVHALARSLRYILAVDL
jgi:hypothetical protein